MGQSIVNIRTFGEALRNTGYKSIDSAVAEIVDNSIEAKATENFIILHESVNQAAKRKVKCIHEIAFLDNGIGMDEKTLGVCLGYGVGTRYERKGMGRFGVGLPQASMYACPRVEVFSWQGGIENCKSVYLDIREVTDGTQTEIEEPKSTTFPVKYQKFLKYKCKDKEYDFSEHGTLIIWRECDRVAPKTIPYLKPQLEFSLGQKYRYFLSDGICNIRIINYNDEDNATNILPNDPLFLMENNRILGNPENPGSIEQIHREKLEPLFEPYITDETPNGIKEMPVRYWDREEETEKQAIVTLKFSKIKSKFYDRNAFPGGNPGGSKMGGEVKKMQGISVVRAGREIDFGKFDYFDNDNKPTHRWWGCEISFTPELDEAFGVANNKQYVELKKVDANDYFDEDIQPMWLQLNHVITSAINSMVKENEMLQKNSRSKKGSSTPAEDIVTNVEKKEEDDNGCTDGHESKLDNHENDDKIKEVLRKTTGDENPTQEQIDAFKNSEVKIIYEDRSRAPFFDYDFKIGTACIYINISHDFYKSFVSTFMDDVAAKTAFELFMAAFVKAVQKTNVSYREAYDRLMTEWDAKLKKYIDKQLHPGE